MPSKVLVQRSTTSSNSPGGTGEAGQIAIGFGSVGGSTTPALWASDGAGWRQVNPPPGAITQQAVDLNTPGGADVGAAAAAWIAANAAFTGDMVIGTFGVPAQAYILTNPATPGQAGSWTSLGGAVSFATLAEMLTGTDTIKALNSKGLRDVTLDAPSTGTAAAADANKIVRLDAQGQIDSGFLKFGALTYQGNVDVTAAFAAPAPAWNSGDFGTIQTSGTADASWNAKGVTGAVKAGDLVIFDGTNYHVIAQETDLTAYLPLAGGTMTNTAAITFGVPAGAGLVTRLDGTDAAKSRIDNFTIDCGTY